MKQIKFFAMLIVCSMMLTLVKQPVYASDIDMGVSITPFYAQIASTTTALTGSGGKASCQSTVKSMTSNSSLKIFMYLEKYTNGTWTPHSSWSDSKTGSSLTMSKSVSISSGTYRVKASYYCNGENTVKYSASKTF